MFDNIENLKIVSSFYAVGKPFLKKESRITHAFFLRRSGAVLYHFGEKKILCETGSMMFTPKGSSYTAVCQTPEHSYTSIHFEGDFPTPPSPACFSLERFPEAEFIGECFTDLWNFGTTGEKYRCYSLFYSLLSHVAEMASGDEINREKFRVIEPAVEYMKKHLFDCDLKVERLHRLCGISTTHFRNLFIKRFSVSPQNYILSKRISHARALLHNGDFSSISEVALSSGFADPLYFSRVYKKAYGLSPSKEIK